MDDLTYYVFMMAAWTLCAILQAFNEPSKLQYYLLYSAFLCTCIRGLLGVI